MSARRYLQFPVNKTGVYANQKTGELEFWVFNQRTGNKKQIGGCKMNLPQQVKDEWENTTANALKALLATEVFKREQARHGKIIVSSKN